MMKTTEKNRRVMVSPVEPSRRCFLVTPMCQMLCAHLWISGLSIFFCTLLLRAFPYGIPYPDTGSFLANAQTFGFFTPNGNDWARTIPFGALLQLSLLFKNPSFVVALIHCYLFIVAFNLVLWSIRPLFPSPWISTVIATSLLFLEVSLMHVFFYNVILLADAPYSHLVFIGALLILGSWLRKKPIPLYLGFATLGLAWFVKPVGLALLPSWGLFAIFGTRSNALKWPHTWWQRVTLALLFLLAPTLLWSARNAVVYGSFRSSAMSGSQALAGVLPFVENDDIILKDSSKNQQFINSLHIFEENFGTEFNTYLYQGTEGIPNPFQTLARILEPEKQWIHASEMGFEKNGTHWNIALRIGFMHPIPVLRHILKHYIHFFQFATVLPQDPSNTYREQLSSISEEHRKLLYPPEGSFDKAAIDIVGFSILEKINISPLLLQTFKQYDVSILNILFHSLFLICLFLLVAHQFSSKKDNTHLEFSISILMLLSTAFFHNLAAALAGPPIERYALPGEMPLHLAFLLTVPLFAKIYLNGGLNGR